MGSSRTLNTQLLTSSTQRLKPPALLISDLIPVFHYYPHRFQCTGNTDGISALNQYTLVHFCTLMHFGVLYTHKKIMITHTDLSGGSASRRAFSCKHLLPQNGRISKTKAQKSKQKQVYQIMKQTRRGE